MRDKKEITVKRGEIAITLASFKAKSEDYKEGFSDGVDYILKKLGWRSYREKIKEGG